MYYLRNQHLTVSILDPIQDHDRLGPRFCTGGYIYQIEDAKAGTLLSGPEFPAERPSSVNGQGLPEVFQFTLYEDEREVEEDKLIIGVGIIEKRDAQLPYNLFTNAQTKTFCTWQISHYANSMRMATTQIYKNWALALEREIRLDGRAITISTQLQNLGSIPLPFRWFAHPFFPINSDWQCCRFLMPAHLPENPAYFTNANGFVEMHGDYHWQEGSFQLLDNCQGEKFSALQLHPQLGKIHVRGDFPLLKVAIWANDRTFSFEPFYQETIMVNQERAWSIHYHF
jgi:hypothetical protein